MKCRGYINVYVVNGECCMGTAHHTMHHTIESVDRAYARNPTKVSDPRIDIATLTFQLPMPGSLNPISCVRYANVYQSSTSTYYLGTGCALMSLSEAQKLQATGFIAIATVDFETSEFTAPCIYAPYIPKIFTNRGCKS